MSPSLAKSRARVKERGSFQDAPEALGSSASGATQIWLGSSVSMKEGGNLTLK